MIERWVEWLKPGGDRFCSWDCYFINDNGNCKLDMGKDSEDGMRPGPECVAHGEGPVRMIGAKEIEKIMAENNGVIQLVETGGDSDGA